VVIRDFQNKEILEKISVLLCDVAHKISPEIDKKLASKWLSIMRDAKFNMSCDSESYSPIRKRPKLRWLHLTLRQRRGHQYQSYKFDESGFVQKCT
jgi:hypothetical protein